MEKSFAFEEAGKTFSCQMEDARDKQLKPWWWFSVSGDGQRYALFHAEKGDTRQSVQRRIVEHYDAMIAARNAPREPWRGRFGSAPAAKPVAPQES
jgi:hypothetical protein